MAMDMFMVITGIEGETKDKVYSGKNGIDVLAWSWGMSNSGSAHVGGGQGSGKVNVQDLSFTKYIDKASTKLMLHACNGKHIDKAVLTVRKAGENPLEYLVITMEKLIVTSVSTGGSGGEDRLTENVALNFTKVTVDYKEQTDKGGGQAGTPLKWNIEANSTF